MLRDSMNLTHLHLALNHIPVLGTAFGLALLIFGIWQKSNELKNREHWWSDPSHRNQTRRGPLDHDQRRPRLSPIHGPRYSIAAL